MTDVEPSAVVAARPHARRSHQRRHVDLQRVASALCLN